MLVRIVSLLAALVVSASGFAQSGEIVPDTRSTWSPRAPCASSAASTSATGPITSPSWAMVARSMGDHVSCAVDVESMEVVAVIPVGQAPKRVAMVRMAVDED